MQSNSSNGNELLLLLLDGLWKVKAKYIALCSNTLAKLQNARGTSRHPVLMDNCPTCNDMARPYQSTE